MTDPKSLPVQLTPVGSEPLGPEDSELGSEPR